MSVRYRLKNGKCVLFCTYRQLEKSCALTRIAPGMMLRVASSKKGRSAPRLDVWIRIGRKYYCAGILDLEKLQENAEQHTPQGAVSWKLTFLPFEFGGDEQFKISASRTLQAQQHTWERDQLPSSIIMLSAAKPTPPRSANNKQSN